MLELARLLLPAAQQSAGRRRTKDEEEKTTRTNDASSYHGQRMEEMSLGHRGRGLKLQLQDESATTTMSAFPRRDIARSKRCQLTHQLLSRTPDSLLPNYQHRDSSVA